MWLFCVILTDILLAFLFQDHEQGKIATFKRLKETITNTIQIKRRKIKSEAQICDFTAFVKGKQFPFYFSSMKIDQECKYQLEL